jgi:uncharacterized protein YbcI
MPALLFIGPPAAITGALLRDRDLIRPASESRGTCQPPRAGGVVLAGWPPGPCPDTRFGGLRGAAHEARPVAPGSDGAPAQQQRDDASEHQPRGEDQQEGDEHSLFSCPRSRRLLGNVAFRTSTGATAAPGANRSRPGDATERLHAAAAIGCSGMPEHGEMRAALSNALVALMKEHYGKGPTAAKSFINDEYVFTILEGGLTRNEETLLATGRPEVVREYRLAFQQAVREEFTDAVARITGRKVLDYHSQIVFDPPRSFEMFVLDGPPSPPASDPSPS